LHFPRHLEKKYDKVCEFCKKHKTSIQYVIYGIFITGTVYYTQGCWSLLYWIYIWDCRLCLSSIWHKSSWLS